MVMKNEGRTKTELTGEIKALRRRLTLLEKSEARRKEAEERIKENEERLYRTLRQSPIPMFVIGKDRRVIYWNRALEELSGIRAKEIIGTRDHWRAFYKKKRPCMADLLIEGKVDRIPEWYAGKYSKSKLIDEAFEATDFFPELGENGKCLRFTAAIIRDSAKNLVGVLETLEDITEKRRAEEELKESEQRLYSILQNSPIPAFVIGNDHRVIFWNRALEELSKIPADEILGTTQHWRAFYKKERPCMADLLVDSEIGRIPKWYVDKYTKSGLLEEAFEATDFFPDLGEEGKWLRFTAAAIRDSSRNRVGALETLEDITERMKAEEELNKIRRLESLGTLASGVAQDFDLLLSAMLRNIFLAKISIDEEDTILEEGLAIAEKAGLQAKELMHQLITFAKGGYPVRKVSSLSPIILDAAAATLSESVVRCNFLIPDTLWPADIDEGQIRQVFHNVIQNAREAMSDVGTMDIRAENITLEKDEEIPLRAGHYVRILIQDRGIGIPKENLTRIFDPYFTTKKVRTHKGLGLGLAVCYSIIKNHNGLITVESEVRKGTTVQIYLPATPP
ncbi:MAG TPA: PAS domain S-box protein [Syntrophales bacterium]|nr:PAS domain S-box protein [Syntrophales bacterium]HOX93726.1 PAS domain S-box protein [Syntrophales bacterium]HPI57071.1 PAS domain S-box protein [Syntrophales bacterium]HPN23799.1 PAS domain S-box protein [Syntrophales bacterium]HQM30130.1 PAS domain S-box protein [Syntrophales bacterium]